MALLLPNTPYDPLGPQTESKMAAHDVICLHTMAGSFEGTEAMFEKEGFTGTDSHFGLRADGYLEQWQDLMYQVDANLDGNSYCISFECEDRTPPFPYWTDSDVPAFTVEQMDKLVYALDILCSKEFHQSCPSDWACHSSGIPRVLIPDSKRTRRGIGYHRLGINPWRVSGGVLWSNANGKICPGDRRIQQIKENIVPRVAAMAEHPLAPILGVDDDMTLVRNKDNNFTILAYAGKLLAVTGEENWASAQRGGVPVWEVEADEYNRIIRTFGPVVK